MKKENNKCVTISKAISGDSKTSKTATRTKTERIKSWISKHRRSIGCTISGIILGTSTAILINLNKREKVRRALFEKDLENAIDDFLNKFDKNNEEDSTDDEDEVPDDNEQER